MSSASSKASRVCAVIVTYFPQVDCLKQLLAHLQHLVQGIIIIDNTEGGSGIANWIPEYFPAATLLTLGRNVGLGAAHNIGVKYAAEGQYDYIIQFDQDSIPQKDMIHNLIVTADKSIVAGQKVAAVGPNWVDNNNNIKALFIRYKGFRKSYEKSNEVPVISDFLITSGCLIPLSAILDIGYFDENLFIEYVDIEWCLRAKAKGYLCYGVPQAILEHHLGDEGIEVLGRKLYTHSPLRHYYLFRNFVLLSKRAYISWDWKLHNLIYMVIRYLLYTISLKPRWQHFKMMSLGIWHGLIGRTGKYKG